MPQKRNYSFGRHNPDHFDQVEVDGQMLVIPANIGTSFWAVLRVCFENANRPIYASELFEKVAAIMKARDAAKWEGFCHKRGAKPWQERLIMCAMMLVRRSGNHPYGYRLAERGHSLTLERDDHGASYFVLQIGGRESRPEQR
jgi:hypothetical protein